MPHEAHACRKCFEGREPIVRADQVIPLVRLPRRGVDERRIVHFGGQRKGAEEGRASRVEPLARPFGGRTRVPVEPREIQPAEDSVLVITGHDRARARADQVHASRGVRSVPDDVAEAEYVVRASVGIAEDRV